jgi:hypothetical protein
MRATCLLLALGMSGAGPALADDPTVYLDGPSDLARLRQTNPAHYARAERILARANQLCRPGAGRLEAVAGASDLRCESALLRTSNPPKREIHFRLDAVRYVALVTITDDPPRLTPAREGFSVPYGESR